MSGINAPAHRPSCIYAFAENRLSLCPCRLPQPVLHELPLKARQEPSSFRPLSVSEECQVDCLEELLSIEPLLLGHVIDLVVNLCSALLVYPLCQYAQGL